MQPKNGEETEKDMIRRVRSDPNAERKRKIRRIAIVEIIFMALGVVAVLLPLPWRLVALIALGARGIIIRARAEAKKLPPAGGGDYVYETKRERYRQKSGAGKRGKR